MRRGIFSYILAAGVVVSLRAVAETSPAISEPTPAGAEESCAEVLNRNLPPVEIQILNLALSRHVSQKKITPEITQRAIIRFMDLIDPFRVTLTAEEREKFSHLSSEDLKAVQSQLFMRHQRGLFEAIEELAINRLNELNHKFMTNKEFRDRAIEANPKHSVFINANQSAVFSNPPRNESEIETRYLDIFSGLTSYFSGANYASYAHLAAPLTKSQAFLLAIRQMRRNIVPLARAVNEYGTSWLIAKAYIAALDPHSHLDLPDEAERLFNQMSGQYSGIGVGLAEQPSGYQITHVAPGSSAEMAGLAVGDVITHVADPALPKKRDGNWWLLRGLSQPVTDFVGGAVGSQIHLRVQRGKQAIEKTLTRKMISRAPDKIDIEVVGSPQGSIAMVRFDDFYHGVSKQLKDALEKVLEQNDIKAIALDLRGNPGGDVSEMVKILSLFVKSGSAVQIASLDKGGHIHSQILMIPNSNRPLWTGPMIAMTDGGSASASEALAGALQDYDRAIVVGSTTYGKGSAQQMEELKNGAALWLTQVMFFTPAGRSSQKGGIMPDVVLPEIEEQPTPERNLPGVIEPFAIPKSVVAKQTFIPHIKSVIKQLREISAERLAKAPNAAASGSQDANYEQFNQNTRESLAIAADLIRILHGTVVHKVTRP